VALATGSDVPAEGGVGEKQSIERASGSRRRGLSEAVGRKFHRVLGPGDEDTMPRPHEVQSVSLIGRVKSMEGDLAYLTYEGTIAGAHETPSKKGNCRGGAKLMGVGVYDLRARRLVSVVGVFDGIFRGPPPSDKVALPYTGVVDWRRERR
jgi:hypothetical protein